MLRSSMLRTLLPRVSVRISPVIQRRSPVRFYAQSWDNKVNNDKIDAHIKVQQLMDRIHSNPEVMQKLEKVSQIMIEKKLVNNDNHDANGERSFKPMQMIKILMDKDLRLAMNEFKGSLDKAGIQLGPDQLGPLMTVLGIEKEKKSE
ncbi:Uncharacterized protein RNJ44_01644 [Nakaseomyces bracarensis]|uniref:Altered inheritance of mitochondria protein 41 n=1 Tax=Nakaseomyces bracarensis TaxID=273131 RepID=A0ABR4NND6_9SACH